MLSRFSHVQLFETLWTIAHQAPLSMGFSRQEYWTELPCPPPGDFPNPGIKPASLTSPALAGRFFTTSTTKSMYNIDLILSNVAKFASKMISVDTPTNSREDNLDFGLRRSELNPGSHLTAVGPIFSVPIRNLVMPCLQEGHVKYAARGGLPQHHCPTFSTSPTELCLAVLPELS